MSTRLQQLSLRLLFGTAALLLLGALETTMLHAQTGLVMQLHYGGIADEAARSGISQTTDKGYIMAGESNSNRPDFDIYVVKTVYIGDVTWGFQYNIGDDDFAEDVQQTSDGGYIVVGRTHAPQPADVECTHIDEIFLLKLDAAGGVTWVKTYGGTRDDQGWGVRELSDHSGYLVTGRSNSFTATGDYDAFLMRTNNTGGVIWAKTYGGANTDYFFKCVELTSGDIVAGGATSSFTAAGDADIFLVRVNAGTGAVVFAKHYGWGGNEGTRCVRELGNVSNDLILACNTTSFPNNSEGMLVQMTSAGVPIACETYGGATVGGAAAWGWDELMDVRELYPGGNIIATGFLFNAGNGFGNYDAFVQEVFPGVLVPSWQMVYGGTDEDRGWSLTPSVKPSGALEGFAMAGLTKSFVPNQEAYLVRALTPGAPQGWTPCNSATPSTLNQPQNLPETAITLNPQDVPTECTPRIERFSLPQYELLCRTAKSGVEAHRGNNPSNDGSSGSSGSSPSNRRPIDSLNLRASVPTVAPEHKATLFPNPMVRGDMLTLEYASTKGTYAVVTVNDLTGRQIYQHSDDHSEGMQSLRISTEGWASGVYVIQINLGSTTQTDRLIVVDK